MPALRAASSRRLLRQLPAMLGVALLFGAVYVVQHEFRSLKLHDIQRAMGAIPHRALLVSFLFTVLTYGILTFYDRLGTIYAGRPVSHARAAFASFCAYSLAHNLGFAAVSGAAVRYRLYSHWGLSPIEIGKVIGFCSLTFGLGGLVLGGAVLLGEPSAVPYFGSHVPGWVFVPLGLLLWLVVLAYMTLSSRLPMLRVFGHRIDLPHPLMALGQVLLASIDVAVTAMILYVLLPAAPGLSYPKLLGVYLASYSAGLLASLPGGLGVFDGAILLGLSRYLPAPAILGAVVVFRLYYYVIPLFLAGTMFAGNEILMRGRSLLRPAPEPASAAARARWSEPDLAVAAGAGAVALCGFMLLSLGVLEPHADFSWIDPDVAWVAAQATEFVPSLMGAALMVLSAALARRVAAAWSATLLLLVGSAGFVAVQGAPAWIAAVLLLAALLVAPYRYAFYRRARLLSGRRRGSAAPPVLVLVACVLALAWAERFLRWLDDDSFWRVILSPDVPNALRALVALAVAAGLAALWRLLRPGRVAWLPWDAAARERYAALGAEPPETADGLVWGEAEQAGIAFLRTGRVLLALGDPAGTEPFRASAIWRLRDLAQQEGRDPAIWDAGPALLAIYADLGLAVLPLDNGGMPLAEPQSGHEARHFVCASERDLPDLLPLLPGLARGWSR